MKQDMIVILDLGSHENTVVARAIRALGVYSEIYPHDITAAELKALPNVKGIVINGGPNNVIDGVAIDVLPEIYEAGCASGSRWGWVIRSAAAPARTLAASSNPLWAMLLFPQATFCQLCPGLPEGTVTAVNCAVGVSQLTSPTSVEPGEKLLEGT